jgi:hypothetical protein
MRLRTISASSGIRPTNGLVNGECRATRSVGFGSSTKKEVDEWVKAGGVGDNEQGQTPDGRKR